MTELSEKTFSFREFELSGAKRTLTKRGETVSLNSKTFDLLLALVERHGQVLTKDELLEKVWEGQIVEENNLTVQIATLRKALGERKDANQFIATIPGKGYKFVHDLNESADAAIIIENHKIERITIDEIETGDEFDGQKTAAFADTAKTALNQPSSQRGWLAKSRLLTGALITLAIIIGSYFGQRVLRSNSAAERLFTDISIRQLTTNGKVERAALAPDGKTFVYVVNEAGRRSLWLGYVDGGNHLPLRAAANAAYSGLAFALDSNQIYFSFKDDKTPTAALYRMHVSGGAQEKIADAIESFSLSPDNRQIAFGQHDGEKDLLLVADLNGANRREIASFPKNESFVFDGLSWSPDGSRLAFSCLREVFGEQDLRIIEISNGRMEVFEDDSMRDIEKTVWLKNGSGIVVSAIKEDSRASVLYYNIFLVELPDGKLREITGDLSSYVSSLDLSSVSDAILTIEHRQLNNIWLAPADNLSAARQITFGSFGKYDGLWGMDFTPDGKIIYTNSDTKSQFISEMRTDGSSSKPLTMPGKIDSVLNVSNDGRYIVFHSKLDNHSGMDIWRMDSDGGNRKQLTFGGRNFQPFISADNR